MNNVRMALQVTLIIVASACDPIGGPSVESAIVVESYVVAGRTFSGLTIRRTISPSVAYGSTVEPVSGAFVSLTKGTTVFTLVEDTSQITNTFPRRTNHGTYRPAPGDTVVANPGDRLALEVLWNDRRVGAVTTVPPQIMIAQAPATVASSQNSFMISVGPDSLLPAFLVVSEIDHSEPFNPKFNGYNFIMTGEREIEVPLSMLNSLGTVKLFVYAYDQGYFEYLRTRKTGNPTLSLFQPGSVVSDGIGVFAAATLDSVEILVQ